MSKHKTWRKTCTVFTICKVVCIFIGLQCLQKHFGVFLCVNQEFQLKMEGLKQRREELENKELDLRRSLEKFNTFLTVGKLYQL